MADGAVLEDRGHEPAVRTKSLGKPGLDGLDGTEEVPGGVKQVAAMRQHIVSPPIRLGIDRGFSRVGAGDDERLDGIRHRVAMRAVAVPGFQRQMLTQLAIDESLGRLDARIEPFHMTDLKNLPACFSRRAQALDLLHANAQRLLAKHVFSRCQGNFRSFHMEAVGGGDDDRVDVWIGKHPAVVRIGLFRPKIAAIRSRRSSATSHIA